MTDIVVGFGGNKWRDKKSLRFAGVVVMVLIIAVGIGVGARLWLQPDAPELLSKSAVSEAVSEAIDYRADKNYAKAHQVVVAALKSSGLTAANKYDLYLQEGATYLEQKQYDKALQAYYQAQAALPTFSVASAIANAAELKGDKALAKSYYQKAIKLIPSDDPLRDDNKQYLEQRISVLESGDGNVQR